MLPGRHIHSDFPKMETKKDLEKRKLFKRTKGKHSDTYKFTDTTCTVLSP